MATATSRVEQAPVFPPTLWLACEWEEHQWPLGGTTGAAQRPRERHGPAGDCPAVLEERGRATSRVGWPAEARGGRGEGAGRAGLWRHRFVGRPGVAHVVVDSASLAVQRRDRRAQTEGLDGPKRRTMVWRHAAGAKQGWRVGRIPSVMEAARRQRHRERLTTQRAWTRVSKRRKGRLALSGGGTPGGGRALDHPREHDGPPACSRVVGWGGPHVGGHGLAARTEEEEGWSTPGCTGAQSAGRSGCVPQSGHHG
jgi:transposase